MTVLACVGRQHNIWFILIAALICITGSWVTARLFQRSTCTIGLQRIGWHILAALSAGVAVWCTHFIAMLGFDPGTPVGFDPLLTFFSLGVAILGSGFGFALANDSRARGAPIVGGAVLGLAIAAMHYLGMVGYRVVGIVSWNLPYLVASILFSILFSAAALFCAMQRGRHSGNLTTGLMALAILSLHFIGIAALRVTPMDVPGSFSNPEALHVLAFAISGMAMMLVAAGLVSYLIDDNIRAESLENLRQMAMHDSLTGLPNRASYNSHLDREIDLARKAGGKLALIGIDLNRFKEINDLRGHNAGDEVLRILARRMDALLGEGEFVARVGGDEFAAIHRGGRDGRLADFLSRLDAALFKPIRVDDHEVVPGASLGVAIFPDDASDKASLINNADLAMYRAKSGTPRVPCYYEPSMDAAVRERRCLTQDLREAVARNQLSLHYQAQTSLPSGQICGYEALLRWHHPVHGQIPPADFIPLAEKSGLILQIGEWVLHTACAAAVDWEPPYKVAVNLSAVQLDHADIPDLVMEVLVKTGLSPNRLELELTETTILADKERSLHTLRRIKALGVGIALDDFGTGYSSLDTLRSFPFDKIKMDRSFVSEVESSPQTQAIVRAVLALGKSLNIPILAEGIETPSQLALLNIEGCDEAQGFLLGRPEPLDDIVGRGQIVLRKKTHGAAIASDTVDALPKPTDIQGQDLPAHNICVGSSR